MPIERSVVPGDDVRSGCRRGSVPRGRGFVRWQGCQVFSRQVSCMRGVSCRGSVDLAKSSAARPRHRRHGATPNTSGSISPFERERRRHRCEPTSRTLSSPSSAQPTSTGRSSSQAILPPPAGPKSHGSQRADACPAAGWHPSAKRCSCGGTPWPEPAPRSSRHAAPGWPVTSGSDESTRLSPASSSARSHGARDSTGCWSGVPRQPQLARSLRQLAAGEDMTPRRPGSPAFRLRGWTGSACGWWSR